MNALIKIEKRNGVKTVDAKELHEFLEVGRDFSTWIKQRIEKYKFSENDDFVIEKSIPQNGGIVIVYHVSLDMAKELSMVENNEKGREARKYFIAMEKKAKGLAMPNFSDPVLAARAWADEYEKRQELEAKSAKDKPKVEYFNKLVSRNVLLNIRSTAKELKIKEKEFVNELIYYNYLYRDRKNKLCPYAAYVPELFEVKEYSSQQFSGVQTLITPKGRETFRLLFSVPTEEGVLI